MVGRPGEGEAPGVVSNPTAGVGVGVGVGAVRSWRRIRMVGRRGEALGAGVVSDPAAEVGAEVRSAGRRASWPRAVQAVYRAAAAAAAVAATL